MSESETFVILIEFEDGRRDISEVIFRHRQDAESHAEELELATEVFYTSIRRASLVGE
jgi:hypothetical protein